MLPAPENFSQIKLPNESTLNVFAFPLKRPFYPEKNKKFIWALNCLANCGKNAKFDFCNLSSELALFKRDVNLDMDKIFGLMSTISQWVQQINLVLEAFHLRTVLEQRNQKCIPEISSLI